jgi:signal transduction histidine kinase
MDRARLNGSDSAQGGNDVLVRTVRHEVGDLLQTVYATAAILQKRLGPERELELRVLSDMRNRAESCKHFLDLAHDLACEFALELAPLDLAELVRSSIQHFQQKYCGCRVSLESVDEVVVEGDARRLGQVIDQMLAHAGEIATLIRCRLEQSPENKQIEWIVWDNGPALNDDQERKIFTPRYTTRYGRPGFGLALARKLVHLHGGTIAAKSESGGGLCVRVALPTNVAPEVVLS